MSNKQYGFIPSRSTMDTVKWVIEKVQKSTAKYVLLISLDISGAFDNAWWPSIAQFLREMKCPRNLYWLLASFFKDRRIQYRMNETKVEKTVQRGCPQGSKAGPKCWNIIINDLLRSIVRDKVDLISYADDTAVIIEGNSRCELEMIAKEVLEKI